MQYAMNEAGGKVAATKTGQRGWCRCCQSVVAAKVGKIKIPHWAHLTLTECDGAKEETQWHRAWKECYAPECREIVVERDGKRRIADVMDANRVYEFESRRIEREVLDTRDAFWTSQGYMTLWVFRCEQELDERLQETRSEGVLWFKNGWQRLVGFRTPFMIDFADKTFFVTDYWRYDVNGRVYLKGREAARPMPFSYEIL